MTREPILAEAIASVVAAHPIRRVPLKDVLAAAASVDRSAAASVDWRSRVLAAITSLAEQGRVELPKTRSDVTASPPLPSYLQRPAAPKSVPVETVSVVWHADLTWVAVAENQGLLTSAARRFLGKVSTWLPRRRGVRVPLRERSLEIFGDEKELESWVLGPLFGPDRLSFELLECEPCWPPVEQQIFGDADWLIIENYTTYVSICRVAARRGFEGRIVWGSGNQVGTRLSALAAEGERPVRCWYFGDIDAGGFRAARHACVRAEQLGFDAVVPARGLYRLAATHGSERRVRGNGRASQELIRWIHTWLEGTLVSRV
jgi:hypothetical protein